MMKGVIPAGSLVTAVVAVGLVKLVLHYRSIKKKKEKVIPQIRVVHGHVTYIEPFGAYVVRQMGLSRDTPAASRLARVAEDYLRGDKSNSDDSLENLFVFLTRVCSKITDDEIEELNKQLVKELDVSMVAYFSFHWNHNAKIIDQVINGGAKKKSFKMAVLSATRKQRFQRVMKELKAQRWFSTILDMMKAMGKNNTSTPDKGTVVIPAPSSVRSPVLLLIGGGMGAGKSTVVKEIMQGPFWKSVSAGAVVVEADAFKENDVIYRALSSFGDGQNISEAAELVHESSTNTASSLLVTALNEGRDVILDGTMSWEPFVVQTVAMARDIHNKHYRMGPGYGKNADGTIFESYWEPVENWEEDGSKPSESTLPAQTTENGDIASGTDEENLKKPLPVAERKPYRIEFVGIVCDAHMAVVRGMRRAILTKRGVPVKGQLRSHKLFTKSIESYSELVDYVKIFSTSEMGSPPQLIGFKEGAHRLLKDCDEFSILEDLINLNIDATSVVELYGGCNRRWHDLVFADDRDARQQMLTRKLTYAHLQHENSEWDLSSLGNSPRDSPSEGSSASLSRLQSTKSSNSPDSSSECTNSRNGLSGAAESADTSK